MTLPNSHQENSSDILIIGGGVAGLSLALRLADRFEVSILGKAPLTEGSSLYAQGGVAAVLADEDTVEAHTSDTIIAGAGLCHEPTVKQTVSRGSANIRWLIDQGVEFTKQLTGDKTSFFEQFHLTREGGHGQRRVIHVADSTGRAITQTLEEKVRHHPNITVFEHHLAIELITSSKQRGPGTRCIGAYVLDRLKNQVEVFRAGRTILATGGAGKVYLYTSNPDVATGDGIAMAWRVGCRVANMEFIQFHPTCLYHPDAKSFLISEALRGEGGRLKLPNGKTFMHRHDQRAELAPRDIVARAIDEEMKKRGLDYVHLDISDKPAGFIQQHFPAINQRCLEFGYDITKEPMPVVPAAHYLCGGIVTNNRGQTDLGNLYAIGECANTGLHGANRLASNSLLECLVFAEAAANDILNSQDKAAPPRMAIPTWDESQVTDSDEEVVVAHNWEELRRFMWDYVGIVRTDKRLERANRRVDLLLKEIEEYYGNFRISSDLIELRNLALVAKLIITAARQRKESRGLHYSLDYPNLSEGKPKSTILDPGLVDF